jgi:hypothetical protein
MRSSLLHVALSTQIAAVLAGCRAILGFGDPTFDSCVAGADCNTEPPPGWSGPVAFYEGPWGRPPACPDDYPVQARQGNRGPSGAPATCSACACSAPSVTCASTALTGYSHNACNGMGEDATLTPDQCSTFPWAQGWAIAFHQGSPQGETITCAPDGGVADPPALTWSAAGLACAPSAPTATCPSGAVCAPPPPAPFAPRWCIWRDGAATCPTAFPVEHVWEAPQDTRGCTPCQCSTVTGTCTVTTELYTDTNCQTQAATVSGGACTPMSGIQSALEMISYSGAPSCDPTGGDPTGGVQPGPAVTICCPAP